MTYAEKLKDPRWQNKRLEVLNRDNFTCRMCADKKTQLDIHHFEYGINPWSVKNSSLITLCKHCHAFAEFIKDDDRVTKFDLKKYRAMKIKSEIVDGDIIHIVDTISYVTLSYFNGNDIQPKLAISKDAFNDVSKWIKNNGNF